MKKKLYLALALVCALIAGGLLYAALAGRSAPTPPPAPPENTEPEPAPPENTEPEPEPEPYVSPIDFAALQEQNSDIYAWLSLPGTPVEYPVLQHAGGDEYYLRRSIDGRWTVAGSLFTQSTYNSLSFDDPCTIIYGHRMNNDDMFGSLRRLYYGDADFSEINEMVIYLPDRELHFRIFAGSVYSNDHIMYHHDFHDPDQYQSFLDDVYSGRYGVCNVDESAKADTDDQILILETCLRNDPNHRFLVIGKLVETPETDPAEADPAE